MSARKYLEEKDGPLTLGTAIRSERLSREMSLKDFSKLLGVSVPQLSDIERGRRFVSAEKAAGFAKRMGDSTALFIELALQDSMQRSGLKYRIRVEAA
jgi:transcriptional regulator with XRE-family HTH domain